ncbi:MAG: class II fructose-bisphosphate aldolase family protein [Aquiluna sp.]|nr:class II fructose-bisphosphate aldolase family protein [Aquiluna sp.]
MPLVSTSNILETQNCVLALNVVTLEHAEAFVSASQITGTGLVLQLSENAVKYHGSLAPLGSALLQIAAASATPIAVHLDHATNRELVTEAVRLGFTSLMFDGSNLDFEQNVSETRAVVEQGHANGVWVEAEIGEIGGKDGVHAPGVKTSVEDAVSFQRETGVDGLAIAVGSSHAMVEKQANLDLQRISEIAAQVPVPLVLHGSSGVPREQLVAAVEAGIRKINISTELNKTFTESIRRSLSSDSAMVDPRKYLGQSRAELEAHVVDYLLLLCIR